MASGTQVTLAAATAKVLARNPQTNRSMQVMIQNSAAALFLGDSSVTNTAFGYNLAASGVLTITLAPEDTLYGYSVGGATVGVLTTP